MRLDDKAKRCPVAAEDTGIMACECTMLFMLFKGWKKTDKSLCARTKEKRPNC